MTNQTILTLFDLLSNEARNTLHATLGLIDSMDDSGRNPEPGNSAGRNRQSVDKLLRLIDDLRELFSGPEGTGVAAEFDASLRVGEAIELLNLARRNRDSRLLWETAPEPLGIRQDAVAFDQALTPILDLALKMARYGAVRICIEQWNDSGIRLHITPPNSELAEALAHWLRADPDQAGFKSNDDVAFGVALLVAGKRWRALGGEAKLGSEPGCALSLDLVLPSAAPSSDEFGAPPLAPETLNVLVAEDCDDSYALAEVLLKDEALTRARTGLETIDLVKERRFDLIFMDVHMPGMDGYGAIRAIREWETSTANARTPIVVMSSDEVGTQIRYAAQSGCSAFLRKPVRARELLDLLDRFRAARSPAY
jgi:CheY-like chemotaxis protein